MNRGRGGRGQGYRLNRQRQENAGPTSRNSNPVKGRIGAINAKSVHFQLPRGKFQSPRGVVKNRVGVPGIRGRLPGQFKQAQIERNLTHLEEATRKKKFAQELYYGQGKSPLKKDLPLRKGAPQPVSSRLGVKPALPASPASPALHTFKAKEKLLAAKLTEIRRGYSGSGGSAGMRSDHMLRGTRPRIPFMDRRFQVPMVKAKQRRAGTIAQNRAAAAAGGGNVTAAATAAPAIVQRHALTLNPAIQKEIELMQKRTGLYRPPVTTNRRYASGVTGIPLNQRFSML